MPKLAVQQGFWSVPVTTVGLAWPNGSSSTAEGACTGFAGRSSSSSEPGCIGLLDSGTSQIIGSIDQVAAVNAALGGVPSIQKVPFDCGKAVAAVLVATEQALTTDDPDAAANQVGGLTGLLEMCEHRVVGSLQWLREASTTAMCAVMALQVSIHNQLTM